MPWERDIYIALVNLWVKNEEERIRSVKDQQNNQQRQVLQQMKRNR